MSADNGSIPDHSEVCNDCYLNNRCKKDPRLVNDCYKATIGTAIHEFQCTQCENWAIVAGGTVLNAVVQMKAAGWGIKDDVDELLCPKHFVEYKKEKAIP